MILSFFLSSLFSLNVLALEKAKESQRIDSGKKLLSTAKSNSLEFSKLQQQLDLDQINADSLLTLYNWRLTGNLNISSGELAPTSPFSPIGDSESLNANISLEKQTSLGITPYFSFDTNSSKATLPTQPIASNVEFIRASIEAGARFDLMKLIFSKNAGFVFTEHETKRKISEVSKAISERTLTKEIIKSHLSTIKAKKKRDLLNIQCSQYKKLRGITNSRYKRKLIREKDFLLVEVLFKQCLLDEENARNDFRIAIESLKKTSGLFNYSFDYSKINYPVISPIVNLSSGRNKDLLLSSLLFKASQSSSLKNVSKTLPELNFSLGLKSEGSDRAIGSSFSTAFNQAIDRDFISTEFGLNFSHDFGGSSANKLEAKKSSAQSMIDKTNLELLKQSLKRDVIRVGLNLNHFDNSLRRVEEIKLLQKRKSRVFNRDFENGRVAVRELVEAEIAYLLSLQASLNIQDLRMRAYLEAYDISGDNFEKFY